MFAWLKSLFSRRMQEPLPLTRTKGFITCYGYPNDETPDSLTEAGWGAWNNKLTPMAMAVSRDIEAEFVAAGIKPLDTVEIFFSQTSSLVRRWEDRTARSYKGKPLVGRFDIYCPKGRRKDLEAPIHAFRKKV